MNQQDSMELKMITDMVCSVVDTEKIYLFGSFAYGTPKADSDFDIYVLLADENERPLKAMQKINMALARMDIRSVDILADTSSRFYEKCKGPTLERTIASKGVQVRYPNNTEVYEEDMQQALKDAGKIMDTIQLKMQQILKGLDGSTAI